MRKTLVLAGFLRQHRVSRKATRDGIEQQPLGAPVVLGDEVDPALALGVVGAAVAFAQHGARLARQRDRGVAQDDRVVAAQAALRAALCTQKRE